MKKIMVKVGGKEYPTIIDGKGVQRFIENKVIGHLASEGLIDLNRAAKEFRMDKFSKREYLEFYMSMGYSVSGIAELDFFYEYKIENPLWQTENKT